MAFAAKAPDAAVNSKDQPAARRSPVISCVIQYTSTIANPASIALHAQGDFKYSKGASSRAKPGQYCSMTFPDSGEAARNEPLKPRTTSQSTRSRGSCANKWPEAKIFACSTAAYSSMDNG